MNYVKSTIAQNFGGDVSHKLAPKEQQFSLDQVPDLSGKVAVITGGSEGIGYGCSHTLLSHNIKKIFIISLSQEVVDGAVKSMAEEMGDSVAEKVAWIKCDMADLPAVAQTASKIASETDRIDIVINIAARGIMTAQLTEYGVDRHMATNVFGHVVLNSHLLPLMKRTAKDGNTVRIVTMGSNVHESAPSDTDFASLESINKDHGPNAQYGIAKLGEILYARYLNRHLTQGEYPNILANSVHPGFVKTKMSEKDILEPFPLGGYAMSVGMAPFKKDQFQGCVSAMFAATFTSRSGEYICPPAMPEPGSKLAQDQNLGEQLMKLTREIVDEKTGAKAKGCPLSDY